MTTARADTTAVLERAAVRLRRGWTRGVNARDSAGRPCPAAAGVARRWSIHGAIACELAHLELDPDTDDRLYAEAVAAVAEQVRAETWREPEEADHDVVWTENDQAGSAVSAARLVAEAAQRTR